MNTIERIKFFGDIIVHIDVLRGSLSRNLPERKKLDEYREALSKKQLQLADLVFKENTPDYKTATVSLETIRTQLNKTILDLDKIADTLASLGKIAAATDKLLRLAARVTA